jgi:hypothetical protein
MMFINELHTLQDAAVTTDRKTGGKFIVFIISLLLQWPYYVAGILDIAALTRVVYTTRSLRSACASECGSRNTKLHNLQHEGASALGSVLPYGCFIGRNSRGVCSRACASISVILLAESSRRWRYCWHVVCRGYIPVLCELLWCVVVILWMDGDLWSALLARARGYSWYVSMRVRVWLAMQPWPRVGQTASGDCGSQGSCRAFCQPRGDCCRRQYNELGKERLILPCVPYR